MSKIVKRIERDAGVPGLASILAERLAPTDLQSLLLEVYRLRSERLEPAAVLAAYRDNRFVRPSAVAPSGLARWEGIAFSELPAGFEALALSPVCPLGTNSAVAPVDQNWSVATVRNTEVVSDSTNVLALECAVRRQDPGARGPDGAVHLAASHRLLRAQRYENPALLSHFSAFALCSAGRDVGNYGFEVTAAGLHIRFYLRALRAFLGSGVPLRVSVTDLSHTIPRDLLESRLLQTIRPEFERVQCLLDEARTRGQGYYSGLCFWVHAAGPAGRFLELVDGGAVDWTQRYLSDAKERLVISGIGSERLCSEFAGGSPTSRTFGLRRGR
jgi:hypothetical protein